MRPIQIYAETNGNKTDTIVKLCVETDLPVELCVIPFAFNATHQYSAALLKSYLNLAIEKAVEEAHRQGYENGWHDKKCHIGKRTSFPCRFMTSRKAW